MKTHPYAPRLAALAEQVRAALYRAGNMTADLDSADRLLRAFFIARGTQYLGPGSLNTTQSWEAITFLEAICFELSPKCLV